MRTMCEDDVDGPQKGNVAQVSNLREQNAISETALQPAHRDSGSLCARRRMIMPDRRQARTLMQKEKGFVEVRVGKGRDEGWGKGAGGLMMGGGRLVMGRKRRWQMEVCVSICIH